MARGPKNNLLAQQLKLALGNSTLDPSKRDRPPNGSAPGSDGSAPQPMVEVPELSSAKAFWVRQVGAKDHHWATVYLRPQGGVDLYFVRGDSVILDVLGRPNLDATSAVAELLRNGFVRHRSSTHVNWPPPKPPFLTSTESLRRVYSSSKSSWKYVDPDQLRKARAHALVDKGLGNHPPRPDDSAAQARLPFSVTDTAEFTKIGFNWALAARSNSDLSFDFGDGHLLQPSPLGQRTESEVVMGVDFGTSSTKVAIRDVDRQLTFPVYFPSESGVESQITPTSLYSVNGKGSFEGVGVPIDDIKIRALKTDSDDRSLAICVAYLAFVIRFARGQLWRRYSSNFSRRDLKWRFHFGIPASDVRDFPVKDRYLAICRAAVFMSAGKSQGINLRQAADLYRQCATVKGADHAFAQADEGIRLTFHDSGEYFLQEGVKIWPEVMAQTYGFLRSNLWNPQRMSRVMTVDVGAGTLDISLCEVSISLDGDSAMVFTPLATFVDGLGLRNFVRHRYSAVFQACVNPRDRDALSREAERLSQIDWVKTRVPTDLFGGAGFFPRLDTQGDSRPIDSAFKDQMGKMIWSSTVLPAFSGGNYAQSVELPVFLCGGGKGVDFYREFISYYSRDHGFRVRFDMREVRSGDDFMDSDATVFDRVSVAYGLAFPDLGRFIDDGFGAPKAKPALDLTPVSPNWADSYVDKDMV